jgi:choloylglycine hydrolase
VIATDRDVRIDENTSAKIHFLVADEGGDAAAIEHLGGKMVVHRGRDLPVRALTNDTYESSLAYLRSLGPGAAPASASSLDRFARAAHRSAAWTEAGKAGASAGKESAAMGTPEAAGGKTARKTAPDPVEAAFGILKDLSQGDRTVWSIVYDLGKRRVQFRTRAHREIRTLDLATLDFRCETPVRVLDVNARASGDIVGRLVDYTTERNLSLVRAAFAGTDFLRRLEPEVIERVARAPEEMICMRWMKVSEP